MTTQPYPSGKVIGYGYDAKGELVSMSIDGVPFIANIETNDNGLLSTQMEQNIQELMTQMEELQNSLILTTHIDSIVTI